MRIGRLNNRITIGRRLLQYDDYGERVKTISKVADLWADIEENKSVSEQFNSENIQYVGTYKVKVRYNTNIKNGDYMLIDGLTHRISNVYNDLRNKRFTKFDAVIVEGIE